jgi:hypothetical protein
MDLFQPFSPANGATRNIVVSASSQALVFPAGLDSPQLLLVNSGTLVTFVRLSPTSDTAAATTADMPLLPNTSRIVTRATGDAMTLRAIGSGAGSTLYVTPGIGF